MPHVSRPVVELGPLGPRAQPPVPELVFAADDQHRNVARRSRTTGLVQVARGAYVMPPRVDWKPWQCRIYLDTARCIAVARSLPAGAVVGGVHAALLHGLPTDSRPPTVTTLVPPGTYRDGGPAGVRAVARTVALDEVTTVHGVRVTTPLRTALDCAQLLDPYDSLPILDGYLRRAAVPDKFHRRASEQRLAAAHAELTALLEPLAGHRNIRRAREVVTYADGWSESILESRARRLALVLGLPRPYLQQRVAVRYETYFVDLWLRFQGGGFGIEADGFVKYDDPDALRKERRREARLRSVGVEFLRVDHSLVGPRMLTEFASALLPSLPRAVRTGGPPRTLLATPWERRVLRAGW